MKKHFTFMIIICMVITALVGCATDAEQTLESPSEAGETAETASAAPSESEADFSETGTLNLDWGSSVGTDSVFECPWADSQSLVHDMIHATLVKLDTDGKTIVPMLAKLDVSADGKTYTFTLVDNALWHDGEPFSAEDVLFSYNTVVKVPESAYTPKLGLIEGVQDVIDGNAETISGITADGNKVIFNLTAPDNSIISTAFAKIVILPEHLLKDVDPTLLLSYEDYWKKPIGLGPYKIDEMSYPNYFTVVRNDEYFGTMPKIKKAVFTSHITGGVESINADMIAGNLDYVFGKLANDINSAKNIVSQNPDVKMVIVPGTYQRQLKINMVGSTDDKYNDDMQKVEVRQALNLLIDKEAIASFYEGQAVPLTTFVNPEMAVYNTSIPLFQRNAAKAKEMLTAAGFDFDRSVRLLYYYDDTTTANIMELLKQNFAEAGVKLEPFLTTGDLASIIYDVRNWDMMYAGTSTYVDPILNYSIFVPDNGIQDGIFGDVEFRQNEFVTQYDLYKSTIDPTDMKKLGDELQLKGIQYCTIIPVYGLNKICMYNTSKLKLDESIFKMDLVDCRDNKFETWELLQ